MRKPTRPQTILRHAARLVRKGWVREMEAQTKEGLRCNPNDCRAARFCALGAIARVSGITQAGNDHPAVVALSETISRRCRSSNLSARFSRRATVASYNDDVARNAEAVARMMERAADELDKPKRKAA